MAPPLSSTAVICKCTPNGAMVLRRSRRLPTPALQRGYQYAAVTDHSYGLKIAGGMSMAEAAAQRLAIDGVNARYGGRFRLLQGIEANIDAAGHLDLTDDEAATFDVVLAAPHSKLRKNDDQTDRMLTALRHPAVRILAHPRGRISGSRAGVIANWDAVFEAAAAAWCRDRNRRRSSATGPGFHAGTAGTRVRLCLCARQRCTHHGAVVLCRDRIGARTTGRYSRRQDRQLLAPGAAAGLVVGSVVRVPSLSAPQRRLRVGRPLWLPDTARVQQRYPALSGQHDTAVAVVGGGMTGALVAHAFASAGISTTVLESAVVGSGSTPRARRSC